MALSNDTATTLVWSMLIGISGWALWMAFATAP